MNKYTPWAYRKGNSLLHRLSGGAKLAILLCLSLGAFLPGLKVFPPLAIFLTVLSLLARIKPWELLRGSRSLLLFVALIFLFQALEFNPQSWADTSFPLTLNPAGLKDGIIFALRIIFAFASGALFFALTTVGEIKKSLSRLETLLHLEGLNISLLVSLMLMFLPRFFEKWEEAEKAWQSRGGGRGLRKIRVLMPLVIAKMLKLAAETSSALESRGA
ncbi:MAG: energy-coupling factor transporter transmembrane protein EcfT [Treponema sp.]|jgi:biotin transport system permease protein|nr:energy-coupling factor transporter transmembrane protein EcfT [Treponema sp.]